MIKSINKWCYFVALAVLLVPRHSTVDAVVHVGDVLFATFIGYMICREGREVNQ